MQKNSFNYMRKLGIESDKAKAILTLLEEWRESGVPIWPAESKREEERMAVVLGKAVINDPVRFFAPVCPDYPQNSLSGQLGTGVGVTIPPVLSVTRQLKTLLEKHQVPFHFQILLADTEVDIPEIVHLLAGSQEEFYRRCKETVMTTKRMAPDLFCESNSNLCDFTTFSEFFGETWFLMQYFWERIVKNNFEENQQFHTFLQSLTFHRTEKYESQFGRCLEYDQKLTMAIRHYSQYHTIGYWLRHYSGGVLINADSPNLRAIRKPSIISNDQHPVRLEIPDQNLRIPIIVL